MKEEIKILLLKNITIPEKHRNRFFKTEIGGYAEHDMFLGITTPNLKKIANKYDDLPLDLIHEFISSKYNEERLLALFILVLQFQKEYLRDEVYNFYLSNLHHVNNWNLVDSSAHLILGRYLEDKPRDLLLDLANSNLLWERRIAIVATWWFIKKHDFDWTIKLAQILLEDKHDLMHKAVGWMLRELGKKDEELLTSFILKHKKQMPRTMLRYAIEKYPPEVRKEFMKN